jgi:hypothetical protein
MPAYGTISTTADVGVGGTPITAVNGTPAAGDGSPGDYRLDTTNHILYRERWLQPQESCIAPVAMAGVTLATTAWGWK